MANFLYQMHHGHIIINVEGRPFLLDTGSPISIGYEPIEIGRQIFELEQSYMGVTCSYLMEHIGVPIEGMIGADIIQAFNLSIYASERMVQFNHLPPVGDIFIPVKNFMGVPILNVKVAGQVRRVFFDTGAPMSYLRRDLLCDEQPDGRHEDFYPLLGNFLTNTYFLELGIGGSACELRFGELPEELEGLLSAGDVHGIVGTELLKHFGMCLDLKDSIMRLETPYNATSSMTAAS